jgi:phospholipid/cholesterol/gamma-HCH transport system substrate-binding protein
MKRRNEFLVGASVLGAVAAVILGAIFLSDADVGRREVIQTARFRSVGRLQPGAPVVLRGVKIGRVDALRLTDHEWVEADLRVARAVELPDGAAVIAVPASLFGEWQALIVARDEVTDPQIRALLAEAAEGAGPVLPGADLPDIGELTAQASRIAGDVGLITERVSGAIDSSVIANLRAAVGDLLEITDRLNRFARTETSTLGQITSHASRLSGTAAEASDRLNTTLGRVEEATRDGRLTRMMGSGERVATNLDSITTDLRAVSSAARESRETMRRVASALDSVLTRMEQGRGTLGLLASDSALYREAHATVAEFRALLADIKANPRKYFRFSVF